MDAFGVRYTDEKEEFKGKKFLKQKVFKHARQAPPIEPGRRRALARSAVVAGASVSGHQLTALAQAKLHFVRQVFELCSRFHCAVFASVVPRSAPRPPEGVLRKDYVFLFERFFYFLQDRGPTHQGAIVFDELEKVQSKILISQMEQYFEITAKGRLRARQIIPQPFFVHSDLTTLVQVADLVAYTIAWGFRIPGKLTEPARAEPKPFADLVSNLRYQTVREESGMDRFRIWSIVPIDDLRGRRDRDDP